MDLERNQAVIFLVLIVCHFGAFYTIAYYVLKVLRIVVEGVMVVYSCKFLLQFVSGGALSHWQLHLYFLFE